MGLIHIYSGDGKGKTTAAIGLAVRASGRAKKVLIARFMKTDDSGEVAALKQLGGIELIPCRKQFGFYFQMTDQQKEEASGYYTELLLEAFKRAAADTDLLILDEIMSVCNYQLVDEQLVIAKLKEKPEHLEVVLTGRDPSERIKELADYHSEIRMIKHPYTKGISARAGIEY